MPHKFWYALVAAFMTSLLLSLASFQLSVHYARESAKSWCGIVVTLDDTYNSTPPTTPTGLEIAADMAQLRKDLGC